MNTKKHLILLVIAVCAWFGFYLLGLPFDYFQEISQFEMLLFLMVSFCAALPLIGVVTLVLLSGDYLETSLWLAFYSSVPLAILDFIVVGLLHGEGLRFLISHWYLTLGYFLVWIEAPLIGLVLKKLKEG